MTVEPLLAGEKTVTRRLGWRFLKPGARVCAVRKAMGLRKGERIERLAELEIVSVRRELLRDVTDDEVRLEGYTHFLTPEAFVDKFGTAMGCTPGTELTRIEFRVLQYLQGPLRMCP